MSHERFEQDIKTTIDVVKGIAGHPDVSPEEAGEVLLLSEQRLEAARVLGNLKQFSPTEIEVATQFISSLEPAPGSKAEGFKTILRVLEFQRQLATFNNLDTQLLKEILAEAGIDYNEPNQIKFSRVIKTLGYVTGVDGVGFGDDKRYSLDVYKPKPAVLTKGWFGKTKEVRQKSSWLGRFSWLNLNQNNIKFSVFGRDNVIECGMIAKLLKEQFGTSVKVSLESETPRLGYTI